VSHPHTWSPRHTHCHSLFFFLIKHFFLHTKIPSLQNSLTHSRFSLTTHTKHISLLLLNTHTRSLQHTHTFNHLNQLTYFYQNHKHYIYIYALYHKLVNPQSPHHIHALYELQLTYSLDDFWLEDFLLTNKRGP